MAMNLRSRLTAAIGGVDRHHPRVLLLIGGTFAVIVVMWLIVKVLPEQLATEGIKDPVQRDEAIGRARTGVLAILAGSLAAIGAYYTHRTFGLNHQGQITERFTRAVDQLGNTSLDVRLGGIYALERLARESRDDHGAIVEILSAYIREHGRPRSQEAADADAPNERSPGASRLATDVQAALTVLGRPTFDTDPRRRWCVDLRDAHLEGAALADAHLEGAVLADAHLKGALLEGAHLEGANLMYAQLEGATLRRAHLERAQLLGAVLAHADLTDACLERASLSHADLTSASLDGAHLQEALLDFAHLEGAMLDRAHLEGASLIGTRFDAASLREAHLEKAILIEAHLEGADLTDACLDGSIGDDTTTWSAETLWPAGFDPQAPPPPRGDDP